MFMYVLEFRYVLLMIETAENLRREYGSPAGAGRTRRAVHQRAVAARGDGRFAEEIVT